MDREEAFDILGVSPSASDEEILESYQDLVQEKHPDQGGEGKDLGKLVEAKEIALGRQPSELKLVETSIQRHTEAILDQQRKKRESEKTVNLLISLTFDT